MDDGFYSNDMDNYSLQQYSDFSDKPPYGGIDPRLLSSPQNTPIPSNEQPLSPFDYTIFSPQPSGPVIFDHDLAPHSYEPMRHQMLGHRRSVSVPPQGLMSEIVQPPPAMVFHRGGTPLGDSISHSQGSGSTNKKWQKKAAAAAQKRQMQRHSPYPIEGARMQVKRSHTQPVFSQQQVTNPGPTSAPHQMLLPAGEQVSHMVMQNFDIGLANYNAIKTGRNSDGMPTELSYADSLAFGARSDVNTAVLGILSFVERISKDCEAMREFLRRGFKSVDEDEIERVRQEKRGINHKHSTLEDGLEMLPLPEGKIEEEVTVPVTGQDIKDLDDQKTSALLELYSIPVSADMFLHEKKLAYLRFIGASRALMHLVLD
ncbi:hypothetical protein QM012_001452 [Aureobasidium pullulans]|uniref:Uncharacterized protein n=1 Tax=Aureobasidium pullulans TaxID=5580 RepID=A0ABR0TE37_AURPU